MEPEKSFFYNNGYQTWLEISASALAHNSLHYKNLIGTNNKLAFVIKGNGYGHGMQQIATLCNQNPLIDYLCVAQLSEGLTLHAIGTHKAILILGYSDVNPEKAINTNIEFMVDNLTYATTLNTIGKKHAYQFKVHVKIDTGLCRMGIAANKALDFVKAIYALPYITINGIFSHFSASDSNTEFTQQQISAFNTVLDDVSMHGISVPYTHMSNTGALETITYPQKFNFFRIGLGMYGLGPQEAVLKSVMTWKTRIMNIKSIPADSYVSYAGTHKTTRPTTIALLPIGYFDGYNFRLSNKSSVLINGTYVPVLGRIAMNITIIDITDIDAHIHDEVTLLGGYAGIGARDLALAADIKNMREIITNINPALPRIIVS